MSGTLPSVICDEDVMAWCQQPTSCPPRASSERVRRLMQAIRGRDTKPERRIRSELHRLGLRFRIQGRPVTASRRTVDIVFGALRVAVFVDGCFWHGCPRHGHGTRMNSAFWMEKIAANRRRDRNTDRLLARHGWIVVRVWEHEDAPRAARRVARILSLRRRSFVRNRGTKKGDQIAIGKRMG